MKLSKTLKYEINWPEGKVTVLAKVLPYNQKQEWLNRLIKGGDNVLKDEEVLSQIIGFEGIELEDGQPVAPTDLPNLDARLVTPAVVGYLYASALLKQPETEKNLQSGS